ncbi:MAG: DHHA1 domain-containing protein [Oscillospiraceae bacterium]
MRAAVLTHKICFSLLTKFGGHKQAAGVSLKTENIAAFREKINEYASIPCSPDIKA